MSGSVIPLIVLAVITYTTAVGATYAWLVSAYPPTYLDMWHGPAALMWPLFLPACFAHSVVRRRIRERSAVRVPTAKVVKR